MREYNWTVKKSVFAAALVVLAGCGRGIESKDAVRQGIIDHLSAKAGLNVSSLQVDVTAVTFRKDEADATVAIRPRGSTDAGSGMTMNYTLERKGNRWAVKGRRETGGTPHGAMPGGGQAMPPGHPPIQDKGSTGTPK